MPTAYWVVGLGGAALGIDCFLVEGDRSWLFRRSIAACSVVVRKGRRRGADSERHGRGFVREGRRLSQRWGLRASTIRPFRPFIRIGIIIHPVSVSTVRIRIGTGLGRTTVITDGEVIHV